MPSPLRVAFLGCGFITEVHSRHLRCAPRRFRPQLRQPRRRTRRRTFCRRYGGDRSYASYARGHRRPGRRRRGRRRAAALPPRPDAPGARRPANTCSSRSPRSSRWPTTRPCARPGTARAASCSSARTTTTSRWPCASGGCSPSGAIGDLVFAHFTTIATAAEDGRRLAQRRDDGRRRRVLRGGHPLAAHRRQPRARRSPASRATGRRRRGRGPIGAPRA